MKNQITLITISFFHSAQKLGLNRWSDCQIFYKSNTSALLKDKLDNHIIVMASFPLIRKSLMFGIHHELIN